MNIVKENLENQTALIKVTVAPADYSEVVEKALKECKKKANMPGFRPGMVPMSVVNKMYRKGVTAEESYKTASRSCFKFIEDNKIAVVGDVMPSASQAELDFDKEGEFEFCFEIGVAPEVVLDLEKVKLTKYNIAPDQKMMDSYKENFLRRFGKLEDVEEVALDEALTVTLSQDEMTIEDAYVGLIGMSEEERAPFIGKKTNDVMEVNVNELYKTPSQRASILSVKEDELDGINPVFNLTITRIRKFQNPDLTEDLFKEAFPGGEVVNVEQFDAYVKEQIEKELSKETEYKFIDDTRKALVEAAGLALPEEFLKNWLFAVNDGKFSKEEIDKDFGLFLDMMRWDLIKKHFVDTANIVISEDDVKEEAKNLARTQFAYYGMHNVEDAMLENYVGSIISNKEEMRKIYDRLYEIKVAKNIEENGSVKIKNVSVEEFTKIVAPEVK